MHTPAKQHRQPGIEAKMDPAPEYWVDFSIQTANPVPKLFP